mgnify:FL=1
MRAPTPRTFAAAALVVGSLALTGCGNAVESIAKAGVEKAIEDQTGTEIDIDADGGGVTIEGEDSSVKIGSAAELPADFPSEFPLPDGTLISVVQMNGGWTLGYEAVQESEVDRLLEHFTSNGYEKALAVTEATGKLYSLMKDEWVVSLTWDGSGDTKPLVYGINKTS